MDKQFQKEIELKKKMRQLKIFQRDIKESFIRSSGPGGQNVNKVSTCVVLQHIPTGIIVKCQTERTQSMNRQKARRLLVDKIKQKLQDERVRANQLHAKQKRQNRKKPQSLKEQILQAKHRKSDKKSSRKKIKPYKLDDYL